MFTSWFPTVFRPGAPVLLIAAAVLTGCETSRDPLIAQISLNSERAQDLDRRNRELTETVDSLSAQISDMQLSNGDLVAQVGQLRLDMQRLAALSPGVDKWETEQDRNANMGRLLTEFDTRDDGRWLEVKEGLVLIGAMCVKPLLERYAAAEPLALIRVPEVFRALVDHRAATELASGLEIQSVRRLCAEALGALRNPQAIPFLKQHLEDADSQTRHAVAVSLGQLGDFSGVPVLIQELESEDDQERIIAIGALSAITKTDFGFRAYDKDAERRAAAIVKAHEWWKNQPKPK